MMYQANKTIQLRNFLMGLFGAFLYAFSYCTFIVPAHLYAGSVMGISQILQDFLRYLHFPLPTGIDMTGIIFWFLNVPLFLLAFFYIGHGFLYRTILTVLFQSICMTFLPVPASPVVSDPLLNVILGGAVSGFGVGFTLRYGSSGGGMDIIGMYCAKKYQNFSVGKVTLILNIFVYLYCAVTKNLEVSIYSAVVAVISSIATDRAHYQNIKICLHIISTNPEIGKELIKNSRRGVTTWNGYGEYSHAPCYIHMTVISKYELPFIKRIVRSLDPDAFITISTPLSVSGRFLSNLDS